MMETLKGLPLLLLLSAATCAFCADGSDAEILYFQHSVARIYEGKYSEAAGGLRSDGLVKDSEAVMNLLAEQFETFVQSFERLYGKPETDGKVTFIGFHNETDGSGVDYYFHVNYENGIVPWCFSLKVNASGVRRLALIRAGETALKAAKGVGLLDDSIIGASATIK